MTTETSEARALAVLQQCETSLSTLYSLYAERFPEQVEFWQRLAHDETLHAIWVRTLGARLAAGELEYREGRYMPLIFETFNKYINDRIAEVQSAPPSLQAALAIAVDIEDTIVEQQYFAILDGDSERTKRLLTTLSETVIEHAARVKAMWRSYQPAPR